MQETLTSFDNNIKTFFQRPDRVTDPLYIVTVVFNPARYRSRYKLYEDFNFMCRRAGAILYTVEVAFGNREFVLKELAGENYIPLRSPHELWIKENALNIGISHFPSDWKYGGYLDADVAFARADWDNEVVHALQRYKVVQPFSQSIDLSPSYEILKMFRSYAWCYVNKKLDETDEPYYNVLEPSLDKIYPHPGFGMMFRREAFDELGGLIDWAVLGGADMYMWYLLAGRMRKWPESLGPDGIKMLKIWGDRANKYIKKNIGYTDGLLLHHWHGKKINRAYRDRGQVLVDAKFNPSVDLYRDYQGLWQLRPENISLRDGIREYFSQRNEDSIDVE